MAKEETHMKRNLKISFALAGLVGLSACADGPYEPIVDGPQGIKYQQDLAACRQLSLQKQSTNTGRNVGVVIGGLAGAAEADDGDALEGAIAGAVLGGVVGSADENNTIEDARDQIVFNCMRGRGHNVVG